MKLNEKILAQYYDGELNEKEAAEVKRQLESSPDSAQSLQYMETMSSYIQVMAEENLDSVSFDGFDKRILNEIHSQKVQPSLGEKFGVWMREFFEHRKTIWIPTASLAGAACAALLVFGLNHPGGTPPTMPNTASPESWKASVNSSPAASVVTVANADEVNAQAYNIETDTGQRVGVVWIND
ncbi:MAG: hypothetical protein JXX29_01665 [Deltaproteobacteria bacterium]|nr:hypothetical protein [Deltaproteobacteria bacterium]MBN2670347.1 hypothetical protein [Deltaproteobacteria bacterium]